MACESQNHNDRGWKAPREVAESWNQDSDVYRNSLKLISFIFVKRQEKLCRVQYTFSSEEHLGMVNILIPEETT